MSDLIPERQWEEIRGRVALRGIHACEVMDGDTYLGTWIPVHQNDYMVGGNIRAKAESLGVSANSVAPPEEAPDREQMLDRMEKMRAAKKVKVNASS